MEVRENALATLNQLKRIAENWIEAMSQWTIIPETVEYSNTYKKVVAINHLRNNLWVFWSTYWKKLIDKLSSATDVTLDIVYEMDRLKLAIDNNSFPGASAKMTLAYNTLWQILPKITSTVWEELKKAA